MEERTSNRTASSPTVEVMSITTDGFLLRLFSKDYFREKRLGSKPKKYFVSFEQYPHFLGVPEEVIRQVTITYDHLQWKEIDVDLFINDFEKPNRRGVYLGFTEGQLDRLKKYNDKQVAKGGKPWLHDRLFDFPYWRKINGVEK